MFVSDETPISVIDLGALAREETAHQPAWAMRSADLNANLLVFDGIDGVAEHVNNEVDVLVVCVAGSGVITIDGVAHPITANQAVLIPVGASRSLAAAGSRFAYLTCHRRRAGLWPSGAPRPI